MPGQGRRDPHLREDGRAVPLPVAERYNPVDGPYCSGGSFQTPSLAASYWCAQHLHTGQGSELTAILIILEGARQMAQTSDTPVLDLLASMTADSLEASTLEARELMLVRLAALVAVNAPPAPYLLNLGAASELSIGVDEVRGVLTAVAPILGTVRVASATGNIARALGFALETLELEAESEAEDS